MKRVVTMVCFVLMGYCTAGLAGCTTVKAYQKKYLNDAEMDLSARRAEKQEINFQNYREGASGANGGKAGGGCGCN